MENYLGGHLLDPANGVVHEVEHDAANEKGFIAIQLYATETDPVE